MGRREAGSGPTSGFAGGARRRRRRRFRSAFTLVEIMIVVAIIGMLCTLAMASLVMARATARANIAHGDLRVISAAVDQLAFDTGLHPGGLLASGMGRVECWDLNSPLAGLVEARDGLFPRWKGPYIRHVPLDPWGNNYFFDPDYLVGTNRVAVVGSFGPNGRGRNLYDADDVVVIVK